MITEVTGALGALVLIFSSIKSAPSGHIVTFTNVTVKIFQIWDSSRTSMSIEIIMYSYDILKAKTYIYYTIIFLYVKHDNDHLLTCIGEHQQHHSNKERF